MNRISIFLLFLVLLGSCKSPTSDSSSIAENYDFLPTPACSELEKFNLSNAVIYFDDKGMVDTKTYEMLPSSRLLAGMLTDTSIISLIQKNYNFGVVDFSCEYGTTIREIYSIQSFPTIIRTDKVGRVAARSIGVNTYARIKRDVLGSEMLEGK